MHEVLPMTTNDKALIKACHNNGIPLFYNTIIHIFHKKFMEISKSFIILKH
ncbi:hypothetical protein JRD95_01144 [Rickettsia parkeri]|uniref:hypothetical protein n=1 Tax=Rickettsia africae TaxID=35788 RepID=UPI000169C9CB|nr:hypothetical protein [Rickettsia africae]QWB87076.1 hypothetical protein JRD95_01144 [Rickettsia parkeri]